MLFVTIVIVLLYLSLEEFNFRLLLFFSVFDVQNIP